MYFFIFIDGYLWYWVRSFIHTHPILGVTPAGTPPDPPLGPPTLQVLGFIHIPIVYYNALPNGTMAPTLERPPPPDGADARMPS